VTDADERCGIYRAGSEIIFERWPLGIAAPSAIDHLQVDHTEIESAVGGRGPLGWGGVEMVD
jgi:hypothetical protein